MNWKIATAQGDCVNFPEIYGGLSWHCSAGSWVCGAILPVLVYGLSAKTVVEIGIANGFTSEVLGKSVMAVSGEEGLLVSFDISDFACRLGREATQRFGIQHRVYCENTNEIDVGAYVEGREVDLAYVDGDHTYVSCANDMRKCGELLKEGGIMVVHDYAWGHPDVVRAVDEYEEEKGWPKFVFGEIANS